MKNRSAQRRKFIALAIVAVCLIASQLTGVTAQTANNQTAASQDTTSFNQQQAIDKLKKQIAGKENEPAEKVFKNIELLKGRKASRLPGMMEALTGLLGVDCTYCHVPNQWDREDKAAKQITRRHFDMQSRMMKEYFNDENKITCWTCHRGQPKPPQ